MKLFKKILLTISIGLISIVLGSNIDNLAFAQESNIYNDTNEQIVTVKILPKQNKGGTDLINNNRDELKSKLLPLTGDQISIMTILFGLIILFFSIYLFIKKDRRKDEK